MESQRVKPRSNTEWLSALRSIGSEHAAALAELRAYLVRAAMYVLHRHRINAEHFTSAQIAQFAEDCAQEALLGILQRLETFRGESRFTTWAYSFAVYAALVAARRERWKHVPMDHVFGDPELDLRSLWDDGTRTDPDRWALRREALAAIRDGIDHHLTERQRQALKAIIFDEVPLDEVARRWGSNRNAIYKLLHDARRKLKAHLQERGLPAADILDLFGWER